MNAPAFLAGNQAATSPACEADLGDGPSPAAADEPEDVAEEVVSPEQRKARRKRKRKEAESRLSFADELGDGEEEEEASPRASLGALTADRFEAEAKASRKRSSSSSSSSSQRLLRDAALSSAPLSPPPAAPARQWARDGADGSQLPAGQQPLLLHAVACAKGGRPYMEDRHVWVQDLGTLAPRLQGASYACVLDGHGGSRAADYAAAELHRRIAADEALRLDAERAADRVAACFKG